MNNHHHHSQSDFLLRILLALFFVCCNWASINNAHPIGAENVDSQVLDPVEIAAKLLIEIDETVEKIVAEHPDPDDHHFYMNSAAEEPGAVTPSPSPSNNNDGFNINSNDPQQQQQQEERFSAVLADLTKIEELILAAINKANANRQYRLVMRLRPLHSYVQQIHRSMETLRTRVVAIATLSNLAITVSDVLVQFGDVMTSSSVMNPGILPVPPKDRIAGNPAPAVAAISLISSLTNSATVKAPVTNSPVMFSAQETTLSYIEADPETFFKNILDNSK